MNPATAGHALGLRLPPSAIPAECWGAWTVVQRANGFHVSRESANGSRTEALRNDVGRTKIFRKRELADATAARLNAGPRAQRGSGTLDSLLASTALFCLIAAALCWFGPTVLDADPAPTYASYGYRADPVGERIALAAADSRAADIAQCQRMHGANAFAVHLPDGQHRCTDKRGRRLSTRSAIAIVSHQE